MIILDGIVNFLAFVNNNWMMITTIIGLGLAVAKKVKDYLNKSNEEKIQIAKAQINEVMLMLVTEAECDYQEWIKAGAVKRAQVIDQIFAMYPVLSTVTNQEELIIWIDEAIDNALKEMRKIFEENKEKADSTAVKTIL
jgi:hypothetical protein